MRVHIDIPLPPDNMLAPSFLDGLPCLDTIFVCVVTFAHLMVCGGRKLLFFSSVPCFSGCLGWDNTPQMESSCSGQSHWKHEPGERHRPPLLQGPGMATPLNTWRACYMWKMLHYPWCSCFLVCVMYLCGSGIKGDAQKRAESQSSGDRKSDQQHSGQPDRPLRLGAVPPQHGQTCIGKLHTENIAIVLIWHYHVTAALFSWVRSRHSRVRHALACCM